MRRLHSLRGLLGGTLLVACAGLPAAFAADGNTGKADNAGRAATAPASPPEQFVDGIAAVVNKDVITLRELREASVRAAADLQKRGIQVPNQNILQRQVLQSLIMDHLERQEADRLGIRVDDAQVDQAIQAIAQRNRIPAEQMRKEIEKSGATWDEYRTSLRDEVRMNRLRQRTVDSHIVITDAEVDAFLKDQARNPGVAGARPSTPPQQGAPAPQRVQTGPVQIALAQILVRVPEGSSPQEVSALRQKAEDLLARARKTNDFASLAAASSNGPEALQGGALGARPLQGWPDLFVKAVASLQKGQVSDLIQSGNGFHILKVLDRSDAAPRPAGNASQAPMPAPQQGAMPPNQGPVQVTQTHARHILIKTSTVMSDDQARQRLEQIRQRLVAGSTKFEDMARQYSQDSSAPQGGDLGWVNPGEMVPAFEQAMNALAPGEISQPVMSPFGWHLIRVEARRQHDVADELQRMQARQILFERRAEPAFEDWLAQLRNQAYIDNRLEKRERIEQNYR